MEKKNTLISASVFKKNFLKLVDEVKNKKSSFIITKRKTPFAKMVPLDDGNKNNINFFGYLKGITKIKEDIVNSSFEDEWSLNDEQ